jgi:hypothetical protein
MSKSLFFFATKSDLLSGLEIIENTLSLKYVKFGLFDSPNAEIYYSAFDISTLGYSLTGDTVQDERYLVLNQVASIDTKEIQQRRGGAKYEISQDNNPNSIIFSPGGLYDNDFLVAGSISTNSNDSATLGVYKKFSALLTKGFKKVSGSRYNVGPEAMELSKVRRLVTIKTRQSQEFDLKIN